MVKAFLGEEERLVGRDLRKILQRIAAYWTGQNWLKTAYNRLKHPYFLYWGCMVRGFGLGAPTKKYKKNQLYKKVLEILNGVNSGILVQFFLKKIESAKGLQRCCGRSCILCGLAKSRGYEIACRLSRASASAISGQ